MGTLFKGVSISGIVEPGQFYLLFGDDCGNVEGEVDLMYFIRSEDDLIQTLEMEMEIVLASMFPRRKFKGVKKLTDDRHEIRILCHDRDKRKQFQNLYLHRLKPYGEMLVMMREIFLSRKE
jgi:hypothetical protein